ncbi:MAG: hypothetical protein JXA33_01730 [Anaerolineae bacterium]|nr:hypothetical protein [Anaerolineae bacterium]
MIAHIAGEIGAVNVEGIFADGGGRVPARLRDFLRVLGSGQVRRQIAARRESPGEVVHVPPGFLADGAAIRLTILNAHFDALLPGEDVAAVVPQAHQHRVGGHVHLSVDVERLLATAAAYVNQGRRGIGRLHQFRGKSVNADFLGTLPGNLNHIIRCTCPRCKYRRISPCKSKQNEYNQGYKYYVNKST